MNLLTDFAFKKIFGDPENKDLLLDLINSLLQEKSVHINDLIIMNNEQLGATAKDRKAIYDLYCTNKNGDHIIVEIQYEPQAHFVERTLYYSTFLSQKQAVKGSAWKYELKSIYVISLLNFMLKSDDFPKTEFYHKVQLMHVEAKKIVYNNLAFIYLEIPKFNKTYEQLRTHFDKWIWLIRNIEKLTEVPPPFLEPIFMKVLEKAKLNHLQAYELTEYETTLKVLRDNHSVLEYAMETGLKEGIEKGIKEGIEKGIKEGIEKGMKQGIEQGIEKGIEQGIEKGIEQGIEKGEKKRAIETAKIAHAEGFSFEMISKLSGLSIEEIKNLFN